MNVANRSPLVRRTCRGCPLRFYVHPESTALYCSRRCGGGAQTDENNANRRALRSPNGARVSRVCQWCSERFSVTPSLVRAGPGIYCSLDCSKKGTSPIHRAADYAPKPPDDIERTATASCCPYTRSTWPTANHERCLLNIDDGSLDCITHGRSLAVPHHPLRPCDACKPRWRVS